MAVEVTVVRGVIDDVEFEDYAVEAFGAYLGGIESAGDGRFEFTPWDDLAGEPDESDVRPIRVNGFKPEWDSEQTARALAMILNSSIGVKVLAY